MRSCPTRERSLRPTRSSLGELAGLDLHQDASEDLLLGLIEAHGATYATDVSKFGYREQNDYFRGLDALALYVVVRHLKPRRVVEIGQGFSTRVLLAALERNHEESATDSGFTSIDPYSRYEPVKAAKGVDFRVVEEPLQALSAPEVLDGCDLLFVDSSHVYKFGSDVEWEFNELYPGLPANAVLHIHDIFTPYHYPRSWIVEQKRFWNEQYYLEAFLAFNKYFEVYLPLHLLARESSRLPSAVDRVSLHERFKYEGQSLYLRRTSPAG